MFKNMNMRKQITCSMFLMAVIIFIVGMVGFCGMRWLNKSLQEIIRVNLSGIQALESMHEAQTAIQRGERTLIRGRALSDKENVRLAKHIEDTWKQADAAWNIYESPPKSEEVVIAWSRLKPAWEKWKMYQQKVAGLLKAGKRTEAMVIFQGVALESFDRVEERISKIIASNEQDNEAAIERAAKVASLLTGFLIGAIILSIMLAVAIGIWSNREVTHIIVGLKDEVRTIVSAHPESPVFKEG
jgi:hypothetical protein